MAILAAARGVHSAVSGLAQVSPSAHPSGPATGTPAPAGNGTGNAIAGAIWSVIEWIGKVTHLTPLGVLLALGGIGWLISQMPKLPKRTAQQKATDEAIGKAGKATAACLGRFLTGRPISAKTAAAKKAGGASFWNNALPEPEPLSAPPAAMGAIALPGPATGPDFREVLADRLTDFQDWVATLPVPRLLVQLSDVGTIVAYYLAVAGRWLARGVRGVLMLPVALWRGVASYGRWAYVSVLTVRAAVPGVWALYEVAPGRTQAGLLVVGLGAVVGAATGPDGQGHWHAPRPSDDKVYGPALWAMLKAALHLAPEAQKEEWLTIPDRLEDEGAQVILALPEHFLGSPRERQGLDEIVNTRLPGDWVSEWRLMAGGHRAVWTARRAARELVGDEATYGPALWPILRDRLGLDEEADLMEDWLTIPADLSDRESIVRLVLPLHFVGGELDRTDLTTLINLKLPGDWVAKWSIKAGQQDGDHWVEWTHRPPAPPKPACPDFLDFYDPRIQEAIFGCAPGEVVIGMDAFGDIVKKVLGGDTAHWVLSIGTGGGKSNLIQFIIAQLVYQGWTVFGIDPKRNSIACYSGLPGFYLRNDPSSAGVRDMRKMFGWFKEIAEARQYVQLRDPNVKFPGMVFVLEEAGEFSDLSKSWWDRNKPKGARVGDPFWAELASTLRTARSVNGHVLGVFQDLRDDKTGNQGISVLFPEIIMGKYKDKQWERIIGGRMMDIAGNDRPGTPRAGCSWAPGPTRVRR
ncbi:hypothetical protein F7Q99_39300 [Streptomyces kaniharaensis]|uniref:FtsK domain-containing protein n=1 Tax=Streptomyces kaniharaensis TaxID=212423 RepID=A0A6N7L5N3_9ACTN|nr:hypothetical protein [Streptomyces kaniharaensis]MQS18078.1 hypothetical protein [Streptomyces kaniharaensis]